MNILCVPAGVELSELRDLSFANGYLYVANGAKATSNVLCFVKAPASPLPNENWFYVGALASGGQGGTDVRAIDHPFAVEFTADGRTCFVSSQDTNVVTLLNVSVDGKTASVQPGPAGSWLNQFLDPSKKTAFLDGTLVASATPALPPVPATPPVPTGKGGLAYSTTTAGADAAARGGQEKIHHSVRDVVLCNGVLCVADEAAGVVRLYDPAAGTYWGASDAVGDVTHLLAQGTTLLVCAGDRIWSGSPVGQGGETLALTKKIKLPDSGSGMALDGTGNLYVALRKQRQIYRYDASGNSTVLLDNLPDQPEFVVYVPKSVPNP
ncbi:hypothetical protein WJ542_18935 [Paraburkholderia sp. B3]|uniref:hypothetical protein n=1 Tax=Paraburkholderia sp. B3 TaxID=3134791 RepID=UPI003981D53D